MLKRKAFASLQHGFLRSVENVYIYNFVTPNGVWENVFLYNIDTYFLLSLLGRCYALLCHSRCFMPGRCYLPFRMWQMLLPRGRCYPLIFMVYGRCSLPFWNVAAVIAKRKILSSYFFISYGWQMLFPYLLWNMLYHFVLCCNPLYWLMLLPSGRWNRHILLL